MRKFIKFYLFILASLLLLLVIAGILLVTVVNPNDFKGQITQLVEKKTHRNLSIHGNISWSFFPWLGFKVNDVNLNNTAEFDSGKTFMHADNADVSIRFMPLLHGQIEVDHLTLNGLQLNLVKNKAGKANWEDLTNAETTETAPAQSTKNAKAPSLSASSINVTHANITYTDEQTGKIDQISELQLKTSQLNIGKAFPVSLQFQAQSNQPSLIANVSLNSKVTLNLNDQKYILNNVELLAYTSKPEDPNQKLSLSLNGDITADLKQKTLAIANLKASLDNSHFTGYFNVNNFDTQSISFDLAVDQINLDKYLGNKTADSAAISNATNAQPNSAPPAVTASKDSSFESLRKLNLEGNLRAGSLIISNMNLSNVVTKISAHNGVIQVSPINANVYQGNFNGQFSMNVQGTVPSYAINGSLVNIQASEFTKSAKLTGIANISANLTMQGTNAVTLKQSMAGNAKFSMNNAVLNGIDISYQLRHAEALLKKQPAPTDNSKKTDLGQFNGSGTIQKGIFNNNELLMTSPAIQITGSGTANLNNEALNYRLLATEIKNGVPGQLQIPLIVTGTFKNPIITPDLQSLLNGELTQRIQQLINSRKQNQQNIGKGIRRSIMIERLLHH